MTRLLTLAVVGFLAADAAGQGCPNCPPPVRADIRATITLPRERPQAPPVTYLPTPAAAPVYVPVPILIMPQVERQVFVPQYERTGYQFDRGYGYQHDWGWDYGRRGASLSGSFGYATGRQIRVHEGPFGGRRINVRD